MIHKLTDRARLRESTWLQDVRTTDWREVQKPPRDGLGIQACDFVLNLDGEAVAHRIQDTFLEIAERATSATERIESDGRMAEFIHRTLAGITLREASDADFWAYLVTFGCHQYPRWRWPKATQRSLPGRYVGSIRDNAFAALWWWAEVTHDPEKYLDDPDRYAETRLVAGRTTFVLYCVDCAFSGRGDLVRNLGAIQRRERLNDKACVKLGRSVNRAARVVCLDALRTGDDVTEFSNRAYQVSLQLQ